MSASKSPISGLNQGLNERSDEFGGSLKSKSDLNSIYKNGHQKL